MNAFKQPILQVLLPVMLLVVSSVSAYERQAADEPHKRARNFNWMTVTQWGEFHESNLQAKCSKSIDVLFQGDSITRGWLSAGKSVWEANYANQAGANFAISGDTTQNLLWRVTEGQELVGIDPTVVVLLIGSNNFVYSGHTSSQVATGVEAIVNEVRVQLPAARIILLGIFPRGAAADNPLRDRIRRANEQIARLGDNERVYYLEFGSRFLQENGTTNPALMHDSVHLTEQGYEVWAAEMGPLLNRLLNDEI